MTQPHETVAVAPYRQKRSCRRYFAMRPPPFAVWLVGVTGIFDDGTYARGISWLQGGLLSGRFHGHAPADVDPGPRERHIARPGEHRLQRDRRFVAELGCPTASVGLRESYHLQYFDPGRICFGRRDTSLDRPRLGNSPGATGCAVSFQCGLPHGPRGSPGPKR